MTLERLESRTLLAFAAADYFPLGAGNTWDYAGVIDNHSPATARVTSSRANGLTTYNLSQLTPVPTPAPVLQTTQLSANAAGLLLNLIDVFIDNNSHGIVAFTPGIRILNSEAEIGDVNSFYGTDVELSVRSDETGRIRGYGEAWGTAKVVGEQRVNLPDGRFVDALKLTLNLGYDGSAYKDGTYWDFDGTTVATYWLGRGIGVVKMDQTTWLQADTYDYWESSVYFTAVATLTGSSLISAADSDTLVAGVLTQTGTDGNDSLSITAQDDEIVTTNGGVSRAYSAASVDQINVIALDGNDVITIGAGVPGVYVDAGAGNDKITGGDAPDTLTGGAGKDTIDGGAGNDRLNGSGGHDRLIGNAGADRLYGGNENDTLEGGGGVDRIWGGSGDDLLVGGGSNDKLFGEVGNDTIYGGTGTDSAENDPNDIYNSVELLLT